METPVSPTTSATEASRSLSLVCLDLAKTYKSRHTEVRALAGVSLTIEAGTMTVLLGPSGCGKTTLLRSIAGLEQPDQGRIAIDGRTVFDSDSRTWIPPQKRNLSMVFQSYALWPHMTAYDNVAYPLKVKGEERQSMRIEVDAALDRVGLKGLGNRYPGQLSGGQQQRVALARAIASKSRLILFDEPLSNVDARVREQIRREIVALQTDLGFAGLYVTHDQTEASALADQLVVMREGAVEQSGPPAELYWQPRSRYVASFMGAMNEIEGRITEISDDVAIASTIVGPIACRLDRAGLRPHIGDIVDVAVRPEAIVIREVGKGARGSGIVGNVQHAIFLGAQQELVIELPLPDQGTATTLLAAASSQSQIPEGTSVQVAVAPNTGAIVAIRGAPEPAIGSQEEKG